MTGETKKQGIRNGIIATAVTGVFAVGAVFGIGAIVNASDTPTAAMAAAAHDADSVVLAQAAQQDMSQQSSVEAGKIAAQEKAAQEAAAAAQAAADAKAAADAAAAQAAQQQQGQQQAVSDNSGSGSNSGPTLCPAGTHANAVDANGNESNCEQNGPDGQQCQAYDANNVCTNWYKP